MKVGAEPRKVAALVILLVVAAYLLYTNVLSSPSVGPAVSRQSPEQAAPAIVSQRAASTAAPAARAGRRNSPLQEFRPALKQGDLDEQADPGSIDPTLRLDLLAKLQLVKVEGGERSLFEFSVPPRPKTPEPKIIPAPEKLAAQAKAAMGLSAKPVKPPPPPITLRFFGYTTQARQANKRAFFLDGDEIVVATEGELIKRRYKVVRIGVNSVVVEDIEHDNQQTLRLEEQAG